jgi:hypothetical protein
LRKAAVLEVFRAVQGPVRAERGCTACTGAPRPTATFSGPSRECSSLVSALVAAHAAAQEPPPAAPAAAAEAPAAVGTKTWIGRQAEVENSLRTAPIERSADLAVGVTKSSRVFFTPGGPVGSATAKHLPMGRRGGFWEAHQSEIAAYELDRLLGFDIDHSRAFGSDRMPFEKEMTRIDRAFFERLKALDEASVMMRVRPWLMSDGQAHDILKRRDKIVARLEREARKRGAAVVFPF